MEVGHNPTLFMIKFLAPSNSIVRLRDKSMLRGLLMLLLDSQISGVTHSDHAQAKQICSQCFICSIHMLLIASHTPFNQHIWGVLMKYFLDSEISGISDLPNAWACIFRQLFASTNFMCILTVSLINSMHQLSHGLLPKSISSHLKQAQRFSTSFNQICQAKHESMKCFLISTIPRILDLKFTVSKIVYSISKWVLWGERPNEVDEKAKVL
jgi:hypothetical protein